METHNPIDSHSAKDMENHTTNPLYGQSENLGASLIIATSHRYHLSPTCRKLVDAEKDLFGSVDLLDVGSSPYSTVFLE
ncbi:hypothetical protein KIN20_024633 [Parelaphostrongylus tenuis]|uniref:Uncharacterized protein n=1 Tax=Parelaphostrongylus tenuis TaxID=148309 RepID=A0AAD5QWV1_PARTN|nr:hypothetical protein KIN20_024633 [Parelaphostrongylus tenuis]